MRNEQAFINVLKLLKFNLDKVKATGAVAAFNVTQFSEGRLTLALKKAGWEPQGSTLYPSKDGSYFVQKIDGEELAVFEPLKNNVWYLEFSGY
jgi:hypothetical protein